MEQKETRKFTSKWIVSVVVVAVIALATLAVVPQAVQAQDATPTTPQERLPFGGPLPGIDRHGGFGGNIDYQALLAEALGITVEELQAAQEKAAEAALEQAVSEGYITAEEADMMRTQQALRSYLDRDALMAQALGITVEELLSARESGKTTTALLDELGLTAEDVRAALQTAYEQAIQQAVTDGVITQEQADEILANDLGIGLRGIDMGERGHLGGLRGMPNLRLP